MKTRIKTKTKTYFYFKGGNNWRFTETCDSVESLIEILLRDTNYCFFVDPKLKKKRKFWYLIAKMYPIAVKNSPYKMKKMVSTTVSWTIY
jgi:hypothetical protein